MSRASHPYRGSAAEIDGNTIADPASAGVRTAYKGFLGTLVRYDSTGTRRSGLSFIACRRSAARVFTDRLLTAVKTIPDLNTPSGAILFDDSAIM